MVQFLDLFLHLIVMRINFDEMILNLIRSRKNVSFGRRCASTLHQHTGPSLALYFWLGKMNGNGWN